ncbi:unnamed protein product [Rotaria magnacalcarata]|uniref:Uncharacterized protein n=2 Tax=Rotaria magnacalcarata TaxID=392030 RepID=A0A819JCA6_9BILA|nr:unnamed protein product [Rotaria magnacalcarata]
MQTRFQQVLQKTPRKGGSSPSPDFTLHRHPKCISSYLIVTGHRLLETLYLLIVGANPPVAAGHFINPDLQAIDPLNNEPRVLILNVPERNINIREHLSVVNDVVAIVEDEGIFHDRLIGPRGLFEIIAVLAGHGSPEFISFETIDFQQYQNIHEIINLSYTTQDQYVTFQKNPLNERLSITHSVRDDTIQWVVLICCRAFYRNLNYWQQRYFQGNPGEDPEFIKRQWEQRVDDKIAVTDLLMNS